MDILLLIVLFSVRVAARFVVLKTVATKRVLFAWTIPDFLDGPTAPDSLECFCEDILNLSVL